MYHLQVEELEPRRMLNGTSFSPPTPPEQPTSTSACTAQAAERPPSVDHGGQPAPDGPSRTGDGRVDTGLSRGIPTRGSEVAPAKETGPSAPPPPPARSSGTTRIVSVPPGNGSGDNGSVEMVRVTVAEASANQPEPSEGNREAMVAAVEAASEALPERPNSQPPPRFENAPGSAGPRLDGQGLSAEQSIAWAARHGGGNLGALDAFSERLRLPSPTAAATPKASAPDGGQAEEGPALPSPQLSGLLTVLPPADLSTLERGMRQFLEQLDRMGQRLTSDPDGAGLYPWVIAVAAAATACEIARRQLRRSADGPAIELRGHGPLTNEN